MQLRRFTADTTPAALGAVRMAFGDDAIILANRRMGDKVEIIATSSADDVSSLEMFMAQEEQSAKQTTAASTEQSRETVQQHGASSISELSRDIDSVSVDEPALKLRRPAELKPDTLELSAAASAGEPALTGQTLEQINAVAIKAADAVISPKNVGADVVPLPVDQTSEISASRQAETKAMLSDIFSAIEAQGEAIDKRFKSLEVNLWGSQSPERSSHLRKMFSLGIGAELAIRLVERVDAQTPVDDAVRRSLALMKSTLPVGNDKSLIVPGVTVFSGPAGGGKTTALFKLATQHVKQSGNQTIVIIGADTRRIGAFEELQSYGKLLGIPTVQANDATELDQLLTAFSHKQLILIDHGLPEGARGYDIPASHPGLHDGAAFRHLFVLPASLQAVTADALIEKYCSNRAMQCVLTHLDSSARLGELFNAIIRHHLPVAYWSDSHSVQMPLEKADASVLVATAVAMGQRITATADDEWLQRLIQPSQQLQEDPMSGDDTCRNTHS